MNNEIKECPYKQSCTAYDLRNEKCRISYTQCNLYVLRNILKERGLEDKFSVIEDRRNNDSSM